MAPLAIMPPLLSRASAGTSVRSTSRTKAPQADAQPRRAPLSRSASGADKHKTPESATKSICVVPSDNTIYSYHYTIVGVQKPDGMCGKGLIRKARRGKGQATPIQKSVSKETIGSSSKPLRFKRTNKPPTLKSCSIFEKDEEPSPPKDPQITSLKNKIKNLREDVRFLRGQLDDSKIKVKGLKHLLDVCIFSFGRRLGKVARAARVEHALD